MDNSTGDFGRMRSTEYAMGRGMPSGPKARTIHAETVVINPAPAIITALSDVWDRINVWLGRSQAEQAKRQDAEIQRMAKELEERAKESTK
jgi:hypothetical protein